MAKAPLIFTYYIAAPLEKVWDGFVSYVTGEVLRVEPLKLFEYSAYAALHKLPHVTSYGDPPVVVYQQSLCGGKHGNLISSRTTPAD